MTVKELIDELTRCPQDYEILVFDMAMMEGVSLVNTELNPPRVNHDAKTVTI